jgi:alpha-N-acetylglucosaminidase (NAGLU)-like protein/F5/8 type C domain-containing protein/alpha-galactosidase-like protein
MRRFSVLVLTAALLGGTLTPAVAAVPHEEAFDSRPAARALERLVGPSRAHQVTLRTIDKATGKDRFEIRAERGRLVIAGTTPAVQLTGFGWYLRHVAHVDIAINGSQTNLPHRLPLPSAPIAEDSSVDHRFALNDTNEGYAGPYLSWAEWQRRIDVLALHGINEMLVYEGQDAVYQRTFAEFGYTRDEMRQWIPQPGHQAWWLLQNMCCTGSPISQQLIDQRTVLARKMTDRLRELGMTPVLPGYFGTVPTDFEVRNPGANTIPQGTWNLLERPDWLDPTDPVFGQVAATFYRVQSELFGDSTMYKMDLLHEGGKPGTVDVPSASRAVQDALDAAHPGAIWTILGWQKNPLPATLQSIDRSRMFIVDGITEKPTITDRDKDFFGTPYAFGTIWNFGGHQNFGASLSYWNEKFHAWLAKPGTAMNGIALMPEAIDNNPAAVAFFADMPWQDGPVDLDQWFADYATARYGAADPHAIAAWQTIARTAYSWPAGADTVHVTGLFSDEPGLGRTGTALRYDIATFDAALGDLLAVDPRLRSSAAYRFDLVDVARQVLANHSRVDLPRIRAAYAAKDKALFAKLSSQWLDRIRLMDTLLGSNEHFLLGTWQQEASRQARGPREAAALDYDLKSLVTLWATGTDLQDYARREFNGLVGDYYAHRWRLYFQTLSDALESGAEQPAPVDWVAVAEQWAHAGTRFASKPRGDSYRLASQVAALPAGSVAVGIDRKGVRPGGTVRVTATFTNANQLRATGPVTLRLAVPDGFVARPSGPVEAAEVAAAGSFAANWDVTVPAGASPGTVSALTAGADWTSGGTADSAEAGTVVLVGGEVAAPYRTVSNTDASFAQRGDEVSIAAGGEDLWRETREYAAAYRPQLLADDAAVSTTVVRQHGSSAYTRSGLIAGNDLSVPGSGFANIAVTPEHGCMFSWDADADGQLDTYTEVGGFGPRVYVRLGKDGTSLSGSCSSDGKNWTVVGSGAVLQAAVTLDVGLFVSAVNRHTGQEAVATFAGGIVPTPSRARDGSQDVVRSQGKPVTALNFENGRPPTAANDGSRANSPYWGGPLTLGSTWWQVDLGAVNDVSRINVRNYVDGTRWYSYRLDGSLDGVHWYTLGGRSGPRPAADAGDTSNTEARARYVRVTGFSNTANSTFHLTEVTVWGTPAG